MAPGIWPPTWPLGTTFSNANLPKTTTMFKWIAYHVLEHPRADMGVVERDLVFRRDDGPPEVCLHTDLKRLKYGETAIAFYDGLNHITKS